MESSISLLYKMGSKRNNVYSKLMPRKCASRPKKTQKRCVYLFYVLNNNGFPLEGWKNWGERLFWALSATYTNGVINCWTNPGRGWGFRQQHTQMKQNLGIIGYFLSSWKLLILIHTAFFTLSIYHLEKYWNCKWSTDVGKKKIWYSVIEPGY